MHATSRSVMTAARTHPAGIAAPSAVIVTAIILFTLVTSVIVPAMPPGLFGIGSAPAIAPSPDQPRHRIQAQPGPAGPPVLPGLTSGIGRSVPNPSGGNAPKPGGGGQPPVSPGPLPVGPVPPPVIPNPLPVTGLPPGTGPVPRVSPHGSPGSSGGCSSHYVGQLPGSAVSTVVAGTGNALRTVTQVVTSGSAVPQVTSGLAAVTGSALQATGALATSAASAAPAATSALTAPVKAVAAPVTAAVAASSQPAQSESATASQQPSSADSAVSAAGGDGVKATRSVESSVGQALPGAGSLPGVG